MAANDPAAGSVYTVDPSSIVIAANASHGNAVVNADHTVTYTPSGGYAGPDSFTYTMTGNSGIITSTPATVIINVQATIPPTATDDTATANGASPLIIKVLANDTPGSTALNPAAVTVTTAPAHGSTSVDSTTGEITYTANAGFSGADTFQYTVSDAIPETSLPATVTVTTLATAPSVGTNTLTPGTTAVANGSTTGGDLTPAMVGTDPALAQQCVGGCFDFQITGLSVGGSTRVVLPLSAPIPAGAVYRTRMAGVWQNFSITTGDTVASAPAVTAGVCPPSGSPAYVSGLITGNECLQLTIVDGGPNDEDDLANGTIVDPSGIGVAAPAGTTASGGGGCSVSTGRVSLTERGDWPLLLGFIALGALATRRRQLASRSAK